jgi:hypothetical protein
MAKEWVVYIREPSGKESVHKLVEAATDKLAVEAYSELTGLWPASKCQYMISATEYVEGTETP